MEALLGHLSIAVISHHSLLARGIACRLMEFANIVNVSIVDSESPDIQKALQSQPPDVMILDSGDTGVCGSISLRQLFEWVPRAKIICLDASSDSAHVFTSYQVQIASAEQLLQMLQPSSPDR